MTAASSSRYYSSMYHMISEERRRKGAVHTLAISSTFQKLDLCSYIWVLQTSATLWYSTPQTPKKMYRKEICGFLYFNGFPFTNNLNFRAKNCNFLSLLWFFVQFMMRRLTCLASLSHWQDSESLSVPSGLILGSSVYRDISYFRDSSTQNVYWDWGVYMLEQQQLSEALLLVRSYVVRFFTTDPPKGPLGIASRLKRPLRPSEVPSSLDLLILTISAFQ